MVLAHNAALSVCLERQRKLAPGVSGKLLMKWIILASGRTANVEVVSKEFENSEIARCVSVLIRQMQFPKSRLQGEAITFPFKF